MDLAPERMTEARWRANQARVEADLEEGRSTPDVNWQRAITLLELWPIRIATPWAEITPQGGITVSGFIAPPGREREWDVLTEVYKVANVPAETAAEIVRARVTS